MMHYINAVRILHLEAGFLNPFYHCSQVDMLLKAVKRVLDASVKQTLPITLDILRNMFT